MNKIIGLLTAWGVEDWVRPAVKQALEYCDEVLAVVSAFAPQLRRFEDKTYDICKEYSELKLLDYESKETYIRSVIADVLNHMLKNSDLRRVGNWVWILDSDEFYTESSAKEIRATTKDSKGYDKIVMESKFFMINMQHYLNEAGDRMFRITDMNDKFVPTCKWSRTPRLPYIVRRANGLFHYSMLTNTERHRERWLLRYTHPHDPSRFKIVKWLDEIYAKYDLDNEEHWIKENLKLWGIRSPWFSKGFTPDANGRLFKYNGRHPKFIEEASLPKIKDFRKRYIT